VALRAAANEPPAEERIPGVATNGDGVVPVAWLGGRSAERSHRPSFDAKTRMASATGGCLRPIRLTPTVMSVLFCLNK
jgi:hypothetical protein